MRPDLEAIEQSLADLVKILPKPYFPEPATEDFVKGALEKVQKWRVIVDEYQKNASPDDEDTLSRLDKLFAYVTNTISDGFAFRDDLRFNRLNFDRMERQVLAAIEAYKPGVASEAEARNMLEKFTGTWELIQQNATNNKAFVDDDTIERLRDVYTRLFEVIERDLRGR